MDPAIFVGEVFGRSENTTNQWFQFIFLESPHHCGGIY
jgi:hypothetical protein